MSAVKTSERFRVGNPVSSMALAFPFVLVDDAMALVDAYRTRSAAEYACRLLNSDLATINPHAVLGCRVEVK